MVIEKRFYFKLLFQFQKYINVNKIKFRKEIMKMVLLVSVSLVLSGEFVENLLPVVLGIVLDLLEEVLGLLSDVLLQVLQLLSDLLCLKKI